jgi:hypothetical protein
VSLVITLHIHRDLIEIPDADNPYYCALSFSPVCVCDRKMRNSISFEIIETPSYILQSSHLQISFLFCERVRIM